MVFSQTDLFSVIGKTQEVLVQNPADKLVDCSTDVDQQQWRIGHPDLFALYERHK